MAKRYSIRKSGTRAGQPHYDAQCLVCAPVRVLAIGYLSKAGANRTVREHLSSVHGIELPA